MDIDQIEKEIRKSAEQDVDPRVDLAVERTELALERTQLAWVRTLLSLIGGGFVIDKAMEAIHQARLEAGEAFVKHSHLTGMIVTGSGTLLMILVTINYMRRNAAYARMKMGKKPFFAPGFLLSMLTIIIGIAVTYFVTQT
jgi:putative membrane protein